MNIESQEEEDASRVNEASEGIQNGLFDNAFLILKEVVANTPENYIYKSELDGDLTIKFWDKTEFLHYVTWTQEHGRVGGVKQVYWQPSAYPRAYYFLSFIAIEWNQLRDAVCYLERGETLEATNPRFSLEKGQIAMKVKQYQPAVTLFDQVPDVGPHVTGAVKAVALRGKGMALIELGDLAAAEKTFVESLRCEPENKLALNELGYIKHLLSGNVPSPLGGLTSKPSKPTQCARCGKPFHDGNVFNQDGALVYVCHSCSNDDSSKKWWKIWK